jgi:hypothetical protein
LAFWELMLGYVIPLCWYLHFSTIKLYPKPLYVLTFHSLDCDLNVETLVGKCILRWNILCHKNMLIKTYQNMVMSTIKTWLIEIINFYYRFGDYEGWNMILSMNE